MTESEALEGEAELTVGAQTSALEVAQGEGELEPAYAELERPAPEPLSASESEALAQRVRAQKSALLSRFHKAMTALALLSTLGARAGSWDLDLAALLSAHGLMWLNLMILARGVEGLLNKQGAVAGLILVQLALPLAGAWLLLQLFSGAMGSVLIGSSLWVGALLYSSAQRISA